MNTKTFKSQKTFRQKKLSTINNKLITLKPNERRYNSHSQKTIRTESTKDEANHNNENFELEALLDITISKFSYHISLLSDKQTIYEMEETDIWKQFSMNIHKVFSPLVSQKNEDLIEMLTEIPSPSISVNEIRKRIEIQPSKFNKKYKPYNEIYSRVINNIRKYQPLQRRTVSKHDKIPLSVSPTMTFKPEKGFPREKKKPEFKLMQTLVKNKQKLKIPLQIQGYKANFGLPRIPAQQNLPLKSEDNFSLNFQEFLQQVNEKYQYLYEELNLDHTNFITKDNIIEYLSVAKIGRKARGEPRYSSLDSESPEIFTLALNIMDIFDPFGTGVISKEFFYGVLSMHEYSTHGIHKGKLPGVKIDIANPRHLMVLKSQVNKLKGVFCEYSEGKTMKREEFFKVLQSISNNIKEPEEVAEILGIGNKVNFGEFLLAIPFLLENYDKFQQH